MVDPAMPGGASASRDERRHAGAFQDNRVIPFKGIRAADVPTGAQQIALWIV